jgi:hypothetical protein
VNAYWPADDPIISDAFSENDSSTHSCPYNMKSNISIRATSNFYRQSGQHADRLNGDKGKTVESSAAADAAKLRGDDEALAAIASLDTQYVDTDEDGDDENNEGTRTTSHDEGSKARGWIALPDSNVFFKCKTSAQLSEDGTKVYTDLLTLIVRVNFA